MSKTDDAPFELFKQALATTAKAMSQTRDVEVTFSGDGPRAEAERIVLPPPPRDLSPEQAAQARGDAAATTAPPATTPPLPDTPVGEPVSPHPRACPVRLVLPHPFQITTQKNKKKTHQYYLTSTIKKQKLPSYNS